MNKPVQLDCLCLLDRCPGCGTWSLIVDQGGRCWFGSPDHPAHAEMIARARRRAAYRGEAWPDDSDS